MKTIGCIAGVLIAVTATVLASDTPNNDACGIDHEKFLKIATETKNCKNMTLAENRPEDFLKHHEMKMLCFGLSAGYIDPATKSIDVTKVAETVKEIAINEATANAILAIFNGCNKEGGTTLSEDQAKVVFPCFYTKFFSEMCHGFKAPVA